VVARPDKGYALRKKSIYRKRRKRERRARGKKYEQRDLEVKPTTEDNDLSGKESVRRMTFRATGSLQTFRISRWEEGERQRPRGKIGGDFAARRALGRNKEE